MIDLCAIAGAGSNGAAAGSAGPGPESVLPLPDLTRNLLDVLGHCEAQLPADPTAWNTWCGAAEVGSGRVFWGGGVVDTSPN